LWGCFAPDLGLVEIAAWVVVRSCLVEGLGVVSQVRR